MTKQASENIKTLLERGMQFRSCMEMRTAETDDGMIVEGCAVRFDTPTVLYELDGVEYREQIARGALDGADMTDVILNFDHTGKVVARTRNGTLKLTVDSIGLWMRADLSGTEAGKQLYQEIKGGYVDRMSFAFTIREHSYDRQKHLHTIEKIKRVFDVSAVSIPAYEETDISARNYFEMEIKKELGPDELTKQKRKKLLMQTEIMMKGIN